MIIPYRVRRFLKSAAVILVILFIAVVVWLIWLMWLNRFVIYTRSNGAVLDFDMPAMSGSGQTALPPGTGETVPIHYDTGDNPETPDNELTQMTGYYVTLSELQKDMATVRSQIQALPAGTPVLIDVKSITGNFYYSSSVSEQRSATVDIAAMDAFIDFLTSSDIYAIARLPALRDYHYGLNHVSDGLPTAGGYLWMDNSRCYWLNPASDGTVTYLAQIAIELRNLGFDEVVFTDFRFPDTDKIVFRGDKTEAIGNAARTLLTSCQSDSFAVSFTGQDAAFPLPEGRSRLYLENVAAANAATIAAQTGLADPAVNLVFLTENHDTRFDDYSVLRPLASFH